MLNNSAGKYDSEALAVLISTEADAVIMLVLGGKLGSETAIRIEDSSMEQFKKKAPMNLRKLADSIEEGFMFHKPEVPSHLD